MSSSTDVDGHSPSLLLLDSFCLVHVSQFLNSARDMASLQCTCKALYVLLQASSIWARILKLGYGGFKLQPAPPLAKVKGGSASAATEPTRLPNNKTLCRIFEESARDLHPVRFVAVYTDGGVDQGRTHYWADHAFTPNAWAPFCSKLSDNVNLLAILKTGGPDATGELTHRQLMIGCLKWVQPFLSHIPMPEHPETHHLGPIELEEAAAYLSSWTTPNLERFFCQMAARAAAHDALGLFMLRGLPAVKELRNAAQEQRPVDPVKVSEERREAAMVLGQRIQTSPWYDRAYRINLFPVAQLREQRHRAAAATVGQERAMGRDGLGRGNEDSSSDRPHALDEVAMRSDLMTQEAASRVAVIHGLAVSRAGRLSCPVQSGALFAGLLPQDWPWGTLEATGAAAPLQPDGAPSMSSYDAMMRAIVDQPSVKSLNDKLDAESVFAACADGQLQPWVHHVVMDHVEYIELLPPHLVEAARGHSGELGIAGKGGNDGTSCGAPAATTATSACSHPPKGGLPAFHPVLWFRFTDVHEYNQRRLPRRAVKILGDVTELFQDAADVLTRAADAVLHALRMEVTAWAEALLDARDASGLPSRAGPWDADAVLAPDTAGTIADTSATGVWRELGLSSSSSVPVPKPRISTPLLSVRSPQPDSLKHALRRAIGLADSLITFGMSADVMLREMQDVARISLVHSEVQDLLDRGKAMKASLIFVAQQLASPEKLCRSPRMQDVPALASAAQCSKREEGLEDKAERLEQQQQEEGDREGEKETKDEMVEYRDEGGDAAVGGRQRSDSHQCRMRMASGVGTGTGSNRLEGTSLWKALESDVLGPEGRQARLALAAALRRKVAAMEAAAASAQSDRPKIVERRNEELLRWLPVEVAAPITQSPAAVTAATSPSLHSGGMSDSGSDAGVVLEPPAPDGWAAERLFDPELQHDVVLGRVMLPEDNEDCHRVVHMAAKLLFPVAANAVVFKAIRPENLMEMVGWDDEEGPNVDVQYVALQGRALQLPSGVQVMPAM